MTPDLQTLESIRVLLESQEWRFAKTMPENPHWYTLRKTWTDDAAFVEVVEFIRKYGYKEVWPPGSKNRYTVLDIGGYHYWTMGWPIGATVLVNRKPVETSLSFAASGALECKPGPGRGVLHKGKDHDCQEENDDGGNPRRGLRSHERQKAGCFPGAAAGGDQEAGRPRRIQDRPMV